jgi:nucleoid DNA-binding protein
MTKKDLVAAIAKEADLTIKDAGKALNAFVASVGKAMKEGERLQLPVLVLLK